MANRARRAASGTGTRSRAGSDPSAGAHHDDVRNTGRSTPPSLTLQRAVGNRLARTVVRRDRPIGADLHPRASANGRRGAQIVQRVLTPLEYEHVRQLAATIMARYPPDRYHYLGLGKSPTPLIAFLQAYGTRDRDVTASNMPLSKFDHRHPNMSTAERTVAAGAELNPEQLGRLNDHFDRFVPWDETFQGKDIVLIDFVQSGRSLVATQRHLEAYLSDRYRGSGAAGLMFRLLGWCGCFPSPPSVQALPLVVSEQQVGGTKKTMDALGLTRVAVPLPGTRSEPGSLATKMGDEVYKPMAEYPADFKISGESRPRTEDIERDPRGLYAQLRHEFAAFMSEDVDLVGLLRGGAVVDRTIDAEQRLEMEVAPLLGQ